MSNKPTWRKPTSRRKPAASPPPSPRRITDRPLNAMDLFSGQSMETQRVAAAERDAQRAKETRR